MRVEQIQDATLYLGDCRDTFPLVGEVDCVITDPPYSDNTHKMAKTNKGAGHGTKLITFSALSNDDFIEVAERCLAAARGWVVMTCDYKHAALFYERQEFVRLGAWVKPNPMPQISADRPGQGFEAVLILHSGRVPKSWNRGGGSGVWTFPVHTGADVPTQKPLNLAMSFVSDFTRRGEVVFDPFLGSGTTGVACAKLGRKFVGCEVNPQHFDIACRRIEAAYKQPDMFVERPPPPKQEAMF